MKSRGTTLVRAAQTVKVESRAEARNDKAPWKTLDLTAITGQTIEKTHLFDVHLGETVVPYATLPPLKALLPLKQNDHELPVDPNGTGGIHLGGLEQRMRGRWQQVSSHYGNIIKGLTITPRPCWALIGLSPRTLGATRMAKE